jgi:hypothetical protein
MTVNKEYQTELCIDRNRAVQLEEQGIQRRVHVHCKTSEGVCVGMLGERGLELVVHVPARSRSRSRSRSRPRDIYFSNVS